MESWLTEKWFGSAFSDSLNQTVMFHRCEGVMNMNCCSRMNEYPSLYIGRMPSGGCHLQWADFMAPLIPAYQAGRIVC